MLAQNLTAAALTMLLDRRTHALVAGVLLVATLLLGVDDAAAGPRGP